MLLSRLRLALATLVVASVATVAVPAGAQPEPVEGPLAWLGVVTDFDTTEVQVNGVAYPYDYLENGALGVFVPANRRLEVVVSSSGDQRRTFRMTLDEGESRWMLVDITNMGAAPAAPPRPTLNRGGDDDEEDEEEEEETGYLGVSSSPRGFVHVDGSDTGERTPARRIPLEPGRHEVQIYYDEEDVMSETKHVLIRAGVNTNVFFRLRRDQIEEGEGNDAPE